MKPILFSLQFRGRARPLRSDRLRFTLSAPSSAVLTTVGPHGISGAIEEVAGAEARLESDVAFGGPTFEDAGTIDFGRGHMLRFRSAAAGCLTASPDANLRHGASVREVKGGAGQFEGATGFITSNFLLSDTGEVTDNGLGLIFIREGKEVK
jgi:hypothetical protein